MIKSIRAEYMPHHFNRFVLVNTSTGEIVDDANGYGYTSRNRAYANWNNNHPTKNQLKLRELNKQFMINPANKLFIKTWFEISRQAHAFGEMPDYQRFKELIKSNHINFTGKPYSLYLYIENHYLE